MKDYKNDSTDMLERFGLDKRKRIVKVESERVSRTPRPHRESEGHGDEQPRRRSFNPNFDAENRPVRSGAAQRPSFGRKERFEDRESGRFDRREGAFDKGTGRFERGNSRFDKGASRFDKVEGRFEKGEGRFERKPKFGSKPSRFDDARPATTKKVFTKSVKPTGDKPKSYPKYKPEMPSGEVRLNKFIAQSGLCSRREADDYILAGVITVNGRVVTELGTKILPTDEVRFNEEPVRGEQNVYLVLNKPKGYVTTLDDPHASKIVTDLVRNACKERIYPVGRLDKNSVGLLLFTNDGDLTRQLTHPSYQKKKIYQVTLDKPITDEDMDRIASGITLEDGDIFADEIACIKDNRKEVGIEIHSGRNRIVRRIFEHLGYEVQKLDRVYYAGLTKKNLKRGAWRFLTREEVTRLKTGMYD